MQIQRLKKRLDRLQQAQLLCLAFGMIFLFGRNEPAFMTGTGLLILTLVLFLPSSRLSVAIKRLESYLDTAAGMLDVLWQLRKELLRRRHIDQGALNHRVRKYDIIASVLYTLEHLMDPDLSDYKRYLSDPRLNEEDRKVLLRVLMIDLNTRAIAAAQTGSLTPGKQFIEEYQKLF